MRGRRITPDVFRLLVRLDEHETVFGERVFRSFREAQARVADAVVSVAGAGRVRAVQLQRVMPLDVAKSASDLEASDEALTPAPASAGLYAWMTEKQWDEPVVRRILAQRGLGEHAGCHGSAPVDTPDADDSGFNDLQRPSARHETDGSITHKAAPPPGEQPIGHRQTRWELFGAVTFALATMALFLILQSGGGVASASFRPLEVATADLAGVVFRADNQPFVRLPATRPAGSAGTYSRRGSTAQDAAPAEARLRASGAPSSGEGDASPSVSLEPEAQ